ncbi:MAG: beta-lactamase family protein [Actinomycetales bacterium]|nr:beta-lactamase family protein [Actinomycetales bacterium]
MNDIDRTRQLEELAAALTRTARTAPAAPAAPAVAEAATGAAAAVDDASGHRAKVFAGTTALFAADGTPLPSGSPDVTPIGPETLFDMASVTKIVTALTALVLIDEGLLDPEAPLSEQLPSPHPGITARHLLTHTSGLPSVMPLWKIPGSRQQRIEAVFSAPLGSAPGTAHAYSCIGFILLGTLLEELTGTALPELARRRVLGPAGASTAGWGVPEDRADRAAATEHQDDPPRGLVRGQTHDETAWSLGGAGNAGTFMTLDDALALGRVLCGRAPGVVLSPATRELMLCEQLPAGVSTGAAWTQGFGLRIGQETAPGAVLPRIVGHPGFTGTSVLADPLTGTVAALLTNRVHPHRDRFTVDRARQRIARIAFC